VPHNPLHRFTSIRVKFTIVIVFAVAVSILLMYVTVGVTLTLENPQGGNLAHDVYGTMAELERLWWQLLLCGAIAGSLALGLARMLARGMTKPLRQMADASRKMSRGDYDTSISTEAKDEVGRLADAFNSMARDLGEVEQLRRDLVANVSHELRTPIAAMRARIENILDGVERADPPTLQIMLDQCDRLGGMVEQLLDLSRLEAGDLQPQLQPVSPADTARAVANEVSVVRKLAGVRIEIDMSESQVIEADPRLFHHLLFNLVDNAARFTPAGGQIHVTGSSRDGMWELTVRDTGPGIPRSDLSKIFERFYRVDRGRSRNDGGTGIGLAVARSIAEAHGGTIWAENSPQGGAVFTVRLVQEQRIPQEVS
jgi:signal transduction histidine kinase